MPYSNSVNPRPGQPRIAVNMPAGFDRVQLGRTIPANLLGVGSVTGLLSGAKGEHSPGNPDSTPAKTRLQASRGFQVSLQHRTGSSWARLVKRAARPVGKLPKARLSFGTEPHPTSTTCGIFGRPYSAGPVTTRRFSATRTSPPSWVWPQQTGMDRGGMARPHRFSYIRGMYLATTFLC